MSTFHPVLGIGVALGFVLGITGHQFVTHRVAAALGDSSGRMTRRMGLSLKAHSDTLGTIIMPAVFVVVALFHGLYTPLFGWGKPHALNPRGLRRPRRDVVLVALAGPAATLAIAGAAGVMFRAVVCSPGSFLYEASLSVMAVNIFLTVFELLPLPGRDGGRILQRFLPPSAALRFEDFIQYEVLFLLVIFVIPPLSSVVRNMASPLVDAIGGHGCSSVVTL